MTTTDNPLLHMTEEMKAYVGVEDVPGSGFLENTLPGFKQALQSRRSIRVFTGEPVPMEVMRDCLSDATLAPSSSNLQPYELYWVRDSTKKEKLAQACLAQPAATTAGELVVVVARRDQWKTNLDKLWDLMTAGGAKEFPQSIDDYYHKITPRLRRTDPLGLDNLMRRAVFWWRGLRAPTIRTPVNTGDHRVWAHTQSSLAAMTLMLSLTAHGYDSCPIGGLDKVRVRRLLGLPKQAEVTMVIAVGSRRPEGLYGPRVRLPYGDLVKET